MNTFTSLEDDNQIHNPYSLILCKSGSLPSSIDENQLQNPSTISDLTLLSYENLLTPMPEYNKPNKSTKLMKKSKKIFKEISSDGSSPSPSNKKTPRNYWTSLEDEKLLELLKQHGPKWSLIGEIIGSKSCKQVRDRYLNFLRPSINNSPFTIEEDILLISLYEKFGRKWKIIGDHMPGRTEVQVKNRYYRYIQKNKSPALNMDRNEANKILEKYLSPPHSQDLEEKSCLGTPNFNLIREGEEEKSSGILNKNDQIEEEQQPSSFEDIFYQLNFANFSGYLSK